ncbi:MAG: TIR domain-containing protein, partial [Clostridiales bacterium]
MSNKLDIFLSYNNDDKEIIKLITEKLGTEKNYRLWCNETGISSSNLWLKELECCIDIINCIVIFVKDQKLESLQKFELDLFYEKTILGESTKVPVIICGKNIPVNLPKYINNYKFIDIDINENSIHSLID